MEALMMATADDEGPVCDISGLPTAWCHDCLHDTHRSPLVGRRGRQAPSGVRHRFIAKYDGRCPCGEAYNAGDFIGVTTDDEYICEGCCE